MCHSKYDYDEDMELILQQLQTR